MQVARPPTVGEAKVVEAVRQVLFSEPILGAAGVQPKGYTTVLLSHLLGWAGPFIAKRATDPLPPTTLYLAVTRVDIRLFSKPWFRTAFEIGRWKKATYRATLDGRRLVLELERLGRVTVFAGASARPVLDLVVQGAAGPAAPASL